MQQQHRLLFGRRPPPFAICTLPEHFESLIKDDDRFSAGTTGATNLMAIKNVTDLEVTAHDGDFGRDRPVR
jgi:hypothetical protein